MEVRELLKKQEWLDKEIMKRLFRSCKTIGTDELLNNKLLALFTEVAEFCNELGSHKYWKQYHVQDDQKIITEFVDILFFWLSIANLLEYSEEDIINSYNAKWNENMERQRQGY